VIAFFPTVSAAAATPTAAGVPAVPVGAPAQSGSGALAEFAGLLALLAGNAAPPLPLTAGSEPGEAKRPAEAGSGPVEERPGQEKKKEDADGSGDREKLPALAAPVVIPAPLPAPPPAAAGQALAASERSQTPAQLVAAEPGSQPAAQPAAGQPAGGPAAGAAEMPAPAALDQTAPGSPEVALAPEKAAPAVGQREELAPAPRPDLRTELPARQTTPAGQWREPAFRVELAETGAVQAAPAGGVQARSASLAQPAVERPLPEQQGAQPVVEGARVEKPAPLEPARPQGRSEPPAVAAGPSPKEAQPAPGQPPAAIERAVAGREAIERDSAAQPAAARQTVAPPQSGDRPRNQAAPDGRNHENNSPDSPRPERQPARRAEELMPPPHETGYAKTQPGAAPAAAEAGRPPESLRNGPPRDAAPRFAEPRPEAPRASAPRAVEETTPAQRQPLRDLSIQVPNRSAQEAGGNIELRISERAGKVQVAVHTGDPALKDSLRQHLPELVSKLEETGYRAETWRPDAPAGEFLRGPSGTPGAAGRETGDRSGRQGPADHGGGQSGNFGQQQSRQDRRGTRPEWIEALEDNLGGQPSGRFSYVR
jgi:hypothetical protein